MAVISEGRFPGPHVCSRTYFEESLCLSQVCVRRESTYAGRTAASEPSKSSPEVDEPSHTGNLHRPNWVRPDTCYLTPHAPFMVSGI